MRVLYFVVLLMLGFAGDCYGQSVNAADSSSINQLAKFMQKHIHYPAIEKENNITGRVFISFTVEHDQTKGNHISEIKPLNNVSNPRSYEVVRTLQMYSGSVLLKPGEYTFSVVFMLGDGDSKILNASGALLEKDKPKNFLFDMTIMGFFSIRKVDTVN